MPKITQTKVGSVFLKEIEPRKWRASWVDPLTKKHIRRIVPAAAFRDAEKYAKTINAELAAGRGFGGRLRGSAGHTVREAILEAVKHTDANQRTREDYLARSNVFLRYLAENVKGIQAWDDVSASVLENYLEHCRKEDIAHDTIRMRIYVLRLTASYMARTYPEQYRNVSEGLRLPRKSGAPSRAKAADFILSPQQYRALLAWLQENAPMVYAWAMLQGLCGLRMLEAAYLRYDDFDLDENTIIITETSAHKPKNQASYRTIPISGAVSNTLREWISGMKVHHPEGYLFFPTGGRNSRYAGMSQAAKVEAYRIDSISSIWRKALKRARLEGLDLPKDFIPRKLRAFFVTSLRKARTDIADLQAYVGHTPDSVLSEFYDHVDMERLREVSTLSQDLFNGTGAFDTTSKNAEKECGLLH